MVVRGSCRERGEGWCQGGAAADAGAGRRCICLPFRGVIMFTSSRVAKLVGSLVFIMALALLLHREASAQLHIFKNGGKFIGMPNPGNSFPGAIHNFAVNGTYPNFLFFGTNSQNAGGQNNGNNQRNNQGNNNDRFGGGPHGAGGQQGGGGVGDGGGGRGGDGRGGGGGRGGVRGGRCVGGGGGRRGGGWGGGGGGGGRGGLGGGGRGGLGGGGLGGLGGGGLGGGGLGGL